MVVLGLAAAVATAGPAGAEQELRLRIAAGPAGEPLFRLGGVLASVIGNPPGGPKCGASSNCGVPGLVAEVVATPGDVASIDAIDEGRAEMAFARTDTVWRAARGTGEFLGHPRKDLRAMAVLLRENVYIVVRRSAGIASVAQLRGRRIGVGEAGAGTKGLTSDILTAYGVPANAYSPVYGDLPSAVARLGQRSIDALVVVSATLPVELEAAGADGSLVLLPVDGAVRTRLTGDRSFLEAADVAAGPLGSGQPVPGVSVGLMWLASAQVPDVVVSGALQALFAPGNLAALQTAIPLPPGLAMPRPPAVSLIPLHPAAELFYRQREGAASQ